MIGVYRRFFNPKFVSLCSVCVRHTNIDLPVEAVTLNISSGSGPTAPLLVPEDEDKEGDGQEHSPAFVSLL